MIEGKTLTRSDEIREMNETRLRNTLKLIRENQELITKIRESDPYFEPCEMFNLVLWWYYRENSGIKSFINQMRCTRRTIEELEDAVKKAREVVGI